MNALCRAPLTMVLAAGMVFSVPAAEPIDIGSRLEPLVDEFLIDRLDNAALQVQKPEPRDVVIVCDAPWEGNVSAYFTVFQDGDRFRMYYRGAHFDEKSQKETHPEFACYAESKDGLHWTKPELGLFEFAGSRANNIVWAGHGAHNFTPFRDDNPACSPEERYKAFGSGSAGLLGFVSADGVRWKLLAEKPLITKGAFDSQNLAFWDPHAKLYREYHRGFKAGVRDIMTGTSKDFRSWSDPAYLDYPQAPQEHLYTNAIQNYPGAEHILLGLPTRFQPKSEQVEPIFMVSRDGVSFRRYHEEVIPITAPQDRAGNRSNYMAWGLVKLPGDDSHHTVYAKEAYYAGPGSRLRQFRYRLDGMVALKSTAAIGSMVTKPLKFSGSRLVLNCRTGDEGSVQAEFQDAEGKPLAGYTLEDCKPLAGDQLAGAIAFKNGDSLSPLAGKPVRLKLVMRDAALYSLQFQD